MAFGQSRRELASGMYPRRCFASLWCVHPGLTAVVSAAESTRAAPHQALRDWCTERSTECRSGTPTRSVYCTFEDSEIAANDGYDQPLV